MFLLVSVDPVPLVVPPTTPSSPHSLVATAHWPAVTAPTQTLPDNPYPATSLYTLLLYVHCSYIVNIYLQFYTKDISTTFLKSEAMNLMYENPI